MKFMTSPRGLFVSVNGLALSAGEVKKWFDRIIKDHKRKDSPFYIGDLALGEIVTKDANGSIQLAKTPQGEYYLDWIKDYLPHFDNVFVGSLSPEGVTPKSSEN